ncbi:MAG TPA: methionine biosynthesis PLP-dependent protein [Metalysinibacillus jejuensis]|uniref:Methionine biosynthesis PLP-dependent protein n=1 Tax=Metalysinibacillus jejuensis TaxID=914327 RepID=A0A921NBK0_9BACL|nr:methionine biosynthesis PLP-dependent protein [Metalysinibacillus jejuensis]HJH10658.1 methionine biosynthesis PLP-dependent protein [Metalysinibacillus jejuensis]
MTTIDTKLVQLGNQTDVRTGAVSSPIYLSTAYKHDGLGESTGFDYTRTKNPTRTVLEEGVANLEEGDAAFACSSGMAAIQLVMSLLKSGEGVIVPTDLYGGTYRLFEHLKQNYDITVIYDDFLNIDTVAAKITPTVKMIFLETPTNPLMHCYNIEDFAKLAKQKGCLLVVDNTFLTPYFQRPLTQGADIVIHSATKYLGGHNDVLAGLAISKGQALSERLAFLHNTSGYALSALDSWLVMRGMKTLHLRMRQHDANAKAVANYLQNHPKVTDVLYAGQGGMLAFRLQDEQQIDPFLRQLKLIIYAESLGGVESFITYPATQTHADVPYEERVARGVCNRLLRFSVGVEEVKDLITDIEQALATL